MEERNAERLPHNQAMKSLIVDFVDSEIVAALDPARLDRRSGEHVSGGSRELCGDRAWREPWRTCRGHLHLPAELQSSSDPSMSSRRALLKECQNVF